MATTIEQQVALDEALVPSTQRLRIGRSNFRLPSDIQSKESTLQVVYNVLSRCPFFKAFLVTADVNWHYVRNDIIFSTIKVVSRHQNTQQYGVMLPIELTNEEIRNTKAYKEYYACATGEVAPKPKASARRKRSGKQPAKAKSPSNPSELARTEAQQLKIVLKRSRHETHISQLGGFGTDEGTGFKPGVPDVPSNDSEEEISWNSWDDEDADAQEKDRDNDEGDEKDESDDGEEDDDDEKDGDESDDDDDDEEEIAKIDEQDDTERDVDINQGRGLQLSQDMEDSHMTITPVNPDGQQESSSVSSQFVTGMLNPTSDAGTESTFATASSSVAPLPIPTPTMTPSIIALVEAYEADKIILDTYGETVTLKRRRDDESDKDEGPSAGSDRGSKRRREGKEPKSASAPLQIATWSACKSTTGSKSRQESDDEETREEESFDPIPRTPKDSEDDGNDELYRDVDINQGRGLQLSQDMEDSHMTLTPVNPDGQQESSSVSSQFMTGMLNPTSDAGMESTFATASSLMNEAVRVAVQIQTDRLHDSYQRQNDEFLRTIDDNMKRIIKEQALVEAYEADKIILDTYEETVTLKRRRDDESDKDEGPSAGSDRGSKRRREGKEPESASAPLQIATRSACKSTTGSKSRQVTGCFSPLFNL
nr:hypothetical protein [Tanacetum cinerariifolium]